MTPATEKCATCPHEYRFHYGIGKGCHAGYLDESVCECSGFVPAPPVVAQHQPGCYVDDAGVCTCANPVGREGSERFRMWDGERREYVEYVPAAALDAALRDAEGWSAKIQFWQDKTQDLQRRLDEAVGQRNGFALELQSAICSEFCGSKGHTERCEQLRAFLAESSTKGLRARPLPKEGVANRKEGE